MDVSLLTCSHSDQSFGSLIDRLYASIIFDREHAQGVGFYYNTGRPSKSVIRWKNATAGHYEKCRKAKNIKAEIKS
jgi:hypothetical protein